MPTRPARWIAWSLVALYVILATTGLTLQFLAGTTYANIALPFLLVTIPVMAIWPAIGALIISRHPRHPVGWLLSLGLLAPAGDMFFSGYVAYDGHVFAGTLPAMTVALTWLNWSGFPFATTAFTLMLLLFPDGRPLAPFWRRLAWLAGGALLLYLPIQAVKPGIVDPFTGVWRENPLAVSLPRWASLEPLWFVALALLGLGNLAAVISLILRLRRARGEERQQIKWLVIPAAGFWASIPFTVALMLNAGPRFLGPAVALVLISVPGMVIATALAIFKHRLYAIELIINRSLVYGALTASVAGLYILIVGSAGLMITTNLEMTSLLITGVLAALVFRPWRAWLQRSVDRLAPIERTSAGAAAATMAGPSSRSAAERAVAGALAKSGAAEKGLVRLPVRLWPILRAGWIFGATLAWGILILAIPAQIASSLAARPGELAAPEPVWVIVAIDMATIVALSATSLISLVLAGVLYLRRPRESMALFLAYFLLVNSVVSLPLSFLESIWPGASVYTYSVIQPSFYGPLLVAFLSIFPNGRLVPSWTRWLIVAAALYGPVGPFLFTNAAYANPTPIFVGGVLLWFGLILTGIYAQVFRYRHDANAVERMQTKWVIYGISLSTLFMILATLWSLSVNSRPQDIALPWWSPLVDLGWSLAYSTPPIALTLAVMRYRLFDIDRLINRTLLYSTLTVGIILIYIAVVGALGTLAQSESNLLISLVATGLIAILFQPLRHRLQRAVNRLTFGERDEPFEALSRLGRRLESVFSPEMIYPAIVETVAEALKLPYAAIAVRRGEQFDLVEAHGRARREPEAYPLVHQGEIVGRLLVGRRSPDEHFGAADQRLLRNFARQAGTAVYAVQLMADLQRSRQQLVTAREEERRRLRRDLHDGLGPTLASVVWQADSARDLVYTEPAEAVQLLENSIELAQSALADIRRLVYGLRPPALDELGLVGALQQAARQYQPTAVTIVAPAPLPALPAAVEVAAYRIAQEALKNAADHGRARHCTVCLALDHHLRLTIGDDGFGLPPDLTPGVGLVSMRERAEELGGAFAIRPRPAGGTEVEVCLPLEPRE